MRDVVAGRGLSPSLILPLVTRLPDDSAFAAMQHDREGWRRYLGWGVDRAIIADVADLIQINTLSTAQWAKGKRPKFESYPRPTRTKKKAEAQKRKPKTVAELFAQFRGAGQH